jgi:hypothetical protein
MTTVNPWKQLAAIVLVALLGINVILNGVIPALSRVDTDFPNYFTAARLVVDGADTDRLYDDAWFQEQMRRYRIGNPEEGKFAPFPPPTAMLLVPLARLEPLEALRVVTALSIVCLLAAAALLARILRHGYIESLAFVLLSGLAVTSALRLGQPYMLVSLSCIAGYYARERGAPLVAGLCFGLFTPLKYFPIVFLVYFACRREWRLALGGAIAILAVVGSSVAVLGIRVHETFLSSVFGHHLTANLSLQDPFTAHFQSFDTLLRRLFVRDASANPHPWVALPWLQPIGVPLIKALILATTIVVLLRLAAFARRGGPDSVAPSIGVLGVVTLLMAPATAPYHCVLLWLPVALLVDYFQRQRAPAFAGLMLGLYALIGFFPYGHAYRFEGRGALTLLAYPRLWLLMAMFALCITFVRTRRAAA